MCGLVIRACKVYINGFTKKIQFLLIVGKLMERFFAPSLRKSERSEFTLNKSTTTDIPHHFLLALYEYKAALVVLGDLRPDAKDFLILN